jgi:hypothetical protein
MAADQDASRADYRCNRCGKSYKSYEELEAHEPECLRAATSGSSQPETEAGGGSR